MKKYFCLFVLIGLVKIAIPQVLNDSVKTKIDRLFSKFDSNITPGYAIGVVRNDTLIYTKSFGQANLEYNIPITAETNFYMCSVSKQFTGYCIALLAGKGKLNINDDVRLYLPWLPDFGKKISILNLLNHTSGVRDDIVLSEICGLGINGTLTQDLALNLLMKQTTLNFVPGNEFSYSNSNYVLLAEIVKTASGQSFRNFVDSAIFKPLGMNEALFQDQYDQLIKDRAVAYSETENHVYKNTLHNIYTLGDGGMFCNVNDMAKWIGNLYNPKLGTKRDNEMFTQKGKLTNGKEVAYAFGIGVDQHKGWHRYFHSGGLAGYRTFVAAYPELKIGFVLFCNAGDNDLYNKFAALTDYFISENKNETPQKIVNASDSSQAILKHPEKYFDFMGTYFSVDGTQFELKLRNKKMYARAWDHDYLLFLQKDTLRLFGEPFVKFYLNSAKGDTILTQIWPAGERMMKKFTPTNVSDADLKTYLGKYYCPELDCNYDITLKDKKLMLTNFMYNETNIEFADKDHLRTKLNSMNHLVMLRNASGAIIGFEVNSGRIMHLRFNKVL